MKKSIFLLAILAPLALFFNSCSNDTPVAQVESNLDFQKKLYKQSMEMADVGTATMALQSIILLDSGKFAYYDTLAGLYYTMGGYIQAIASADKYLKKDPKNIEVLDLLAKCEEKIGNADTTMILYTQLFEQTKKMKYRYKQAQIHLSKNEMKEAQSFIDEVFKSPKTDEDTVDVAMNEQGLTQPVPLRAAAHNLQAFIYLQKNDALGAKKSFENAVKQFPDFQMARYYLQELPKMMQQR